MKGFTDGQYQRFIGALDESIANLCDMFPGRVVFGRVGNGACATNYHVWGANASNWNLRAGQQIFGSGMAAVMGMQREGVFGIVCATTHTSQTRRQECCILKTIKPASCDSPTATPHLARLPGDHSSCRPTRWWCGSEVIYTSRRFRTTRSSG